MNYSREDSNYLKHQGKLEQDALKDSYSPIGSTTQTGSGESQNPRLRQELFQGIDNEINRHAITQQEEAGPQEEIVGEKRKFAEESSQRIEAQPQSPHRVNFIPPFIFKCLGC